MQCRLGPACFTTQKRCIYFWQNSISSSGGRQQIFHFKPPTNVKTTADTIQFCFHKSISLSLASLPALLPLLDFPCLYGSDMLLKTQIDFILEKSSFDCVCSLQDCMFNWMTWVCKFLVGSSSNFSLSRSAFLKKISIGWAIIKKNLFCGDIGRAQ